MRFLPLALLVLALAAPAKAIGYRDVAAILIGKCAICHKGPVLDLQTCPLRSQSFPTTLALATEILRRLRLQTWKHMPPANGTPLTAPELRVLEGWLQAGMPAR